MSDFVFCCRLIPLFDFCFGGMMDKFIGAIESSKVTAQVKVYNEFSFGQRTIQPVHSELPPYSHRISPMDMKVKERNPNQTTLFDPLKTVPKTGN